MSRCFRCDTREEKMDRAEERSFFGGHFLAIVPHLGNSSPGPFRRSEWPCNVLQTFYRCRGTTIGKRGWGEEGWQTISTGRTLCLMFGHVFRSGHAFCYHILCMFARLKCCFSARATHPSLHRLDTRSRSMDHPPPSYSSCTSRRRDLLPSPSNTRVLFRDANSLRATKKIVNAPTLFLIVRVCFGKMIF